MTYRIIKQTCVLTCCALAVLCLLMQVPAQAQDFRVAMQSADAGESVDDDPLDTGEPRVVAEEADDTDADGETLTEAERKARLERRAGEQVGEDPRGRAVILGMHVQEGDDGRVNVVEVGAASPAFDAGVREGDAIVSFDGLQAKSYREWIDGIRKLMRDTPDGETVAVELVRDGKRVSARIRAPEARALDPRTPALLGQQTPQESGAGGQSAQEPVGPNQAFPQGAGTGNDVFINQGAFFGDEFNQSRGGSTERAIAQIYRLDGAAPAATPSGGRRTNPAADPRGVNPSAATGRPAGGNNPAATNHGAAANPRAVNPVDAGGRSPGDANPAAPNIGAGARIGLAGFRNDENGLFVMLDIGGLAPGSYPVGVDDASVAMGAAPRAGTGALGQPQGQGPWATRDQGRISPDGSSAGVTRPTQQTDPNAGPPPTGQVNPSGTPPTGQVDPEAGTPATGQVLPPATPPTGLPDQPVPGQQRDIAGTAPAGRAAGGQSVGLTQIGTLTVDQSGTGRMQQVVEGLQVRDVVGQAIVIYQPADLPETTVPPNTNVSGTATATPGASSGQVQVDPRAGGAQARPLTPAPPQQAANPAQRTGAPTMPIAGGVIQLLTDRRPDGAAPAGDTTVPSATTQQDPQRESPATAGERAARNPQPTQRPTPRQIESPRPTQ